MRQHQLRLHTDGKLKYQVFMHINTGCYASLVYTSSNTSTLITGTFPFYAVHMGSRHIYFMNYIIKNDYYVVLLLGSAENVLNYIM